MSTSERTPRVLVVDDQVRMAEMVADGLLDAGFEAQAVDSGEAAVALLERESFDVIITDLRMPGVDGLQLLEASMRLDPTRAVIVMTAFGAIETAVESVRRGAFHYITKPFKIQDLLVFVRRATEHVALRRETVSLRQTLRSAGGDPFFVAESAGMRDLCDAIARLAKVQAPVLILGESGTGKGRVARALHMLSDRAGRPFSAVNCAAVPQHLLEGELFGNVQGAFTGATSARAGLFAEANGGTIFLDDIGDLPLALQAKLLHVLEHGVVRAVGDTQERSLDVRVVAATHRSLRERVSHGEFREELLYRLDVVSIEVPPLRHRRKDLPMLIETVLAEARARHPVAPGERLSADVLGVLLEHRWPGNVRELKQVIERAVLSSPTAEIGLDALPKTLLLPSTDALEFGGDVLPLRELTRRYAAWAYHQLGDHRNRTAERLQVDPKTISKLLRREEDDDGEGDI